MVIEEWMVVLSSQIAIFSAIIVTLISYMIIMSYRIVGGFIYRLTTSIRRTYKYRVRLVHIYRQRYSMSNFNMNRRYYNGYTIK
jgi:hypothetical protein